MTDFPTENRELNAIALVTIHLLEDAGTFPVNVGQHIIEEILGLDYHEVNDYYQKLLEELD